MPTIQVEFLLFTFTSTVAAEKYDHWQHYRNVWSTRNQKAVDVVAVESATTTWLIEAKDFRIINNPPKKSNLATLPDTVAAKVSHTLAGLVDASANAANPSERSHASMSITAHAKRIVLHLEPPVGQHSALFPTGFAANVLQKLRQLVKATDSNPLVLDIANTPVSGVPWTVG
jgi:hypothetical protein